MSAERSSAAFCGDEVGDVGVDVDAGVDAGEMAAGGFGFGESGAGVVFVEEHLALQVGGLDEVAVDESEPADAGAGQEAGGGCAGGSYANDGDVGAAEELLAGLADAGEEDLAGVAVLIGDWIGGGDVWSLRWDAVASVVENAGICEVYVWRRGIWRGSGKRAANPSERDCICKMKAIRERRKPCFVRLCGDMTPRDDGLKREKAAFEFEG